jgi:hypothetical protein
MSGWGRRWLMPFLAVTLAGASASADEPKSDAAPLSARELLDRAFAARFELDLTSVIELVVYNQEGDQQRRRFHATSKRIGGRVHSVGRLVEPEYLRGMTILTIEAEGRDHDSFLYLPSLGRVRRITTAHRGDAVFGTDVTYEDLERQRVESFEIEPLKSIDYDGEPSYLIEARPRRSFNYATVHFVVAKADLAILAARYFKRRADRPYRIVTASRPEMIVRNGLILPTHLTVRNLDRGTRTEVHLTQLAIDPQIDDHVFSLQALESQRKLPIAGD